MAAAVSTPLTKRIINGSPATLGQFPSLVSISRDGEHICGGALLDGRNVLTAAHCFASNDQTSITVRAGSLKHNEGGQTAEVQTVKRHVGFNDETVENDITILQLKTPIMATDHTGYALLPASGFDPTERSRAFTGGWGATKEGSPENSPNLLYADFQIVDRTTCDAAYKKATEPATITENMFCAANRLGKDTCQRDSGGSLFQDGVVIGIISWGEGLARLRGLKITATPSGAMRATRMLSAAKSAGHVVTVDQKYTLQSYGIWEKIRRFLAVDPNRSTGVPINAQFRNPTPGALPPQSYTDPVTLPAGDIADNPYWKRDVRRNYAQSSVLTQADVVGLLSVGSKAEPNEQALLPGDAGAQQLVELKKEGEERGLSAFFARKQGGVSRVLGPNGLPPLPANLNRNAKYPKSDEQSYPSE
ncbi:hypothetical protein LOZ58_005509 [Ophidiomyces ophidiicola]|nr:hypothetical protein LOZ58_005509 [Ophidiomyces ophidiicola]